MNTTTTPTPAAPRFIVFAGLPGTGKSSVAEAVGRRLAIPVFAKDWLEATLKRCALQPKDDGSPNLGYASYELLTVLAARQLALGQSLILDSVASIASIREEWRGLATQHGARWRVVECVCSDEAAHRRRLSVRQRGIRGWHGLPWAQVERVRGYYHPWSEARLVLDAMDPFTQNCRQALAYIQSSEE